MVFWVPESLIILSPDVLAAGTWPLSDGVAIPMGKTELQDRLGREVGRTFHGSSLGWSSDLVPGACGNHPAPAMTTACQGFDSELVSWLSSCTTTSKES